MTIWRSHARMRGYRYGLHLTPDHIKHIKNKIHHDKHTVLMREQDFEDKIHTVVNFEGKLILLVYNLSRNKIITILPPIAITNECYGSHDFVYHNNKIISVVDMINLIYFKMFREYCY